MLIIRTSPFTGKRRVLSIPKLNAEKLHAWQEDRKRGKRVLIQDHFPELTPDEREFLMSGIHPDEWGRTYVAP